MIAAVDELVGRRHSIRIAGKEPAAHSVVNLPLLCNRKLDGIGWVETVGTFYERPCLLVDQCGVVGGHFPFQTGSRFSAKALKPSWPSSDA